MKLHRLSIAVLLLCSLQVRAAEIIARATKESAVYAANEAITVQVQLKGDDAQDVNELSYDIKLAGAKSIGSGTLELTDRSGLIHTALDHPGTLLITLAAKTRDGKDIKGLAGVAIEPEKIPVSAPRPEDFDAFWAAKLQDIAAVSMNAKAEPVPLPATRPTDAGNTVEYEKITLDNIHGTHVYGQLARPKKEGKYPALLMLQYAGVYPLQRDWAVNRAKQGWLALNIMAHDLPFDLPPEKYKELAGTSLKDYTAIGNTDRETSYFVRMILGDLRAADYLTTRPEWDGKILVVTGTSQGGLQSIATAALDPKVTGMVVCVPAGNDTLAQSAGRAFGWPYWQGHAKGDDADKIMNTSRYFDNVNFASRIKVPSLVALGLIDQTCPASSVYSMVNQLGGKKEIVVMPLSEHKETNGSQAGFHERGEAWLAALRKGEEPK